MISYEAMTEVNRPFLALFFTLVAAFYFFLVKMRKQSPSDRLIHPGHRYTVHWWNHLTFGVFRVLIWVACVLRLFFTESTEWALGSFSLPGALLVVGDLLLIVGFGTAIAASVYMNGQWRSGIDEQRLLGLVTHGPYRFSRNPAYIGVQLGQVGFFLAWPSVFSAVCLVVGLVSVQLQVKLEEAFLQRSYGETYSTYRAAVPRWLFRLPSR